MSKDILLTEQLQVTQFAGGVGRGVCLQIRGRIDGLAQLTADDVAELANTLNKWLETPRSAEQARLAAIDWQTSCQDTQYSYSELIEWQEHFTKLANKFDLVDEFKENGII